MGEQVKSDGAAKSKRDKSDGAANSKKGKRDGAAKSKKGKRDGAAKSKKGNNDAAAKSNKGGEAADDDGDDASQTIQGAWQKKEKPKKANTGEQELKNAESEGAAKKKKG